MPPGLRKQVGNRYNDDDCQNEAIDLESQLLDLKRCKIERVFELEACIISCLGACFVIQFHAPDGEAESNVNIFFCSRHRVHGNLYKKFTFSNPAVELRCGRWCISTVINISCQQNSSHPFRSAISLFETVFSLHPCVSIRPWKGCLTTGTWSIWEVGLWAERHW